MPPVRGSWPCLCSGQFLQLVPSVRTLMCPRGSDGIQKGLTLYVSLYVHGPEPLTPVWSGQVLLFCETRLLSSCIYSVDPRLPGSLLLFDQLWKFCLVISVSDTPYALPSVVCLLYFKEICRPFWKGTSIKSSIILMFSKHTLRGRAEPSLSPPKIVVITAVLEDRKKAKSSRWIKNQTFISVSVSFTVFCLESKQVLEL